ncbi:MAG: DUF1700 domain-containing protein [Actinomycetota bacterium]
MKPSVSNPMVETYFGQLDAKMADLPEGERREFLMELRAHVMDRLEQRATVSDEDCRAVLKALGTPDEIARQYRMELILKRSSWKISPLTVLRVALRWTVAGVQGYLVFIVALVGYLVAASLYLTALLKPFFPHNIGMYVSERGINLADFPIQHGHDIMGNYYIPFAIFVGYLLTFGTTLLIRFLVHRLGALRRMI